MFKRPNFILFVFVIIVSQMACNLLTGAPAAGSQATPNTTSPTSEPAQPVGMPTSTAISLEVPTESTPEVAAPTPALNLDIPQPKSGTGSIAGRLLWNEAPVAGTQVKLCEQMDMINGCQGQQFSAVTDKNGIYLLANVTPGDYALVFHSLDTNEWVYVTSSYIDAKKFTVEADKTVTLEDQNMVKYDLKPVSPVDKAQVSEAKPSLKWDAYPGAAYYNVYVSPDGELANILNLDNYTQTDISPDQALLACDYVWKIEAYNEHGIRIAEYDDYFHFSVINQPVSCNIAVKGPADKSQVAASDARLSWEAHPLADHYKLVVWKDQVGGDVVVNYARIDKQTTYSFDPALAAADYFWVVYSCNAADDMIAKSALYQFTVK